ncbi:IS110 family transposase [Salinispora arenicola]|uniref:IS110 family transposase n=1 Tax=Salinispora arenicola TaxID=168697 RepID=UPI0020798D17|nr:IS110 family transposase [Salinispora arenicola]MCN0155211.1 IS110 family transposase [Salinispora arenicola]
MQITCGIDWAEQHHDVAVLDADGSVLARARIDTGATGFSRLMSLLAEHVDDADQLASVPIGIETDKNLLVVALQAAGMTVFAINPRAVARYRERHGQSGKKSDPGDAFVLADLLRTDRHQHRPLPSISVHASAIKTLARQHQDAIWSLNQTVSRLRSLLLEFYPQALRAFPNLKQKAALAVLSAAPTPEAGLRLTARRLATLLRRCRRRNDPSLAEHVLSALHSPALRQPTAVEAAYGVTAQTLIAIVVAMQTAVEELEQALAAELDQHPLATILRSAPGLGPVLAARVLAEIGDDPTRFTTAAGLRAFAGTAPVTRASGRSRYVKARKVRNKRLGDACHWWAFVTITKSAGARAHYDRRRAAGDHHNAALRNLANKLIGRLWWCLQHDETWNENTAWNIDIATPDPRTA